MSVTYQIDFLSYLSHIQAICWPICRHIAVIWDGPTIRNRSKQPETLANITAGANTEGNLWIKYTQNKMIPHWSNWQPFKKSRRNNLNNLLKFMLEGSTRILTMFFLHGASHWWSLRTLIIKLERPIKVAKSASYRASGVNYNGQKFTVLKRDSKVLLL